MAGSHLLQLLGRSLQRRCTMTRQPKALYLIASVQMWECFSFYGMRVLLVLYMINILHFNDAQAFGVFALYTGLVELSGIVGGMLADRFLGLRRAISLGGWLIASGHLTLALGSHSTVFFPALALIIVGSSLFSTNLSALLSLYYADEDPKREAGYTLFYAGINLGSLLASILCGFIGEHFGWHYGFGLAAIGMLMGNLTLQFFGSILEGKGRENERRQPKKAWLSMALLLVLGVYCVSQGLIYESHVLPFVPWICLLAVGYVAFNLLKTDSKKLVRLLLYLMGLALFFAAEEQMGSSLMLFSDRHATKALLGIPVPPAVLQSINPAVIILFGTVMNGLCQRLSGFGHFPFRIVIPFGMTAAAFGGLAVACAYVALPMPILLIMGAVLVIAFAELIIGPAVYSLCSELTTK
ncbi:MAG: peptide MFS transporter, partial [Parachlamydia sp.]|nr:peptide MFS transporter [Parachlamydia sp.]